MKCEVAGQSNVSVSYHAVSEEWGEIADRTMHIRSDFRKWFPRMCQYGFIEGRDYEYHVHPAFQSAL